MAAPNPTFTCGRCTKPVYVAYAPKKCDKCGHPGFDAFKVAPVAAVSGPIKWSDHKMKHMLPPKKLGKKVIGKAKADTEHGEAKYCITHSAIQKLEGVALEKLNGQSGIYETGELTGWCRGEDCTKIQLYVEITGYHGHPIDDELAEMR